MGIPNRFRGLYRLHLSTQPPITTIMKLTTIRSDGRVEALLITNPWSWRKSHPMSFLSVPSARHGDSGIDQDGLECYKEGRYRWKCAPRVVPVSRSRLAGWGCKFFENSSSELSFHFYHALFLGVEGSVEKVAESCGQYSAELLEFRIIGTIMKATLLSHTWLQILYLASPR